MKSKFKAGKVMFDLAINDRRVLSSIDDYGRHELAVIDICGNQEPGGCPRFDNSDEYFDFVLGVTEKYEFTRENPLALQELIDKIYKHANEERPASLSMVLHTTIEVLDHFKSKSKHKVQKAAFKLAIAVLEDILIDCPDEFKNEKK